MSTRMILLIAISIALPLINLLISIGTNLATKGWVQLLIGIPLIVSISTIFAIDYVIGSGINDPGNSPFVALVIYQCIATIGAGFLYFGTLANNNDFL